MQSHSQNPKRKLLGSAHPVALIILDGWGMRTEATFNAIAAGCPPTFNRLWAEYPHATLAASGPAVGLPEGVMGNSEVGHLTLGAGKVIMQPLSKINQLIENKTLCDVPAIKTNFAQLAREGGALHLIGLVSDGGVHSHQEHLHALIKCAATAGIERVFIHAILDGRDTPPQSAATYLEKLEAFCATQKAGIIASLCGRFYAMDRDEQWERTRAAYDLYTVPPKIRELHWRETLAHFYKDTITDEFVPPTNLHPEAFVRPEDGIFLFNFRPDRMRQLTALLLENAGRHRFLVSMTRYKKSFINPVVIEKEDVTNTLLDRLAQKGLTIFTIAETEKYAHVTYFFSGGREAAHARETQVLVPSLGIKNYADKPCMSAPEITAKIVASLKNNPCDFYLINYANADMVGHTGNFEATVATVTCVDKQLAVLFDEIVRKRNGSIFIVGDHGNAEDMWDPINQTPRTSHTTNPVPFIAVGLTGELSPMLELGDVAGVIEDAVVSVI